MRMPISFRQKAYIWLNGMLIPLGCLVTLANLPSYQQDWQGALRVANDWDHSWNDSLQHSLQNQQDRYRHQQLQEQDAALHNLQSQQDRYRHQQLQQHDAIIHSQQNQQHKVK